MSKTTVLSMEDLDPGDRTVKKVKTQSPPSQDAQMEESEVHLHDDESNPGDRTTYALKLMGNKKRHERQEDVKFDPERMLNTDCVQVVPISETNPVTKIVLEETYVKSICRSWNDTLILKLLGRSINYNILTAKLNTLWNLNNDYELLDLGHNCYMIQMKDKDKLDHILTEGPWIVYNQYLEVRKWFPISMHQQIELPLQSLGQEKCPTKVMEQETKNNQDETNDGDSSEKRAGEPEKKEQLYGDWIHVTRVKTKKRTNQTRGVGIKDSTTGYNTFNVLRDETQMGAGDSGKGTSSQKQTSNFSNPRKRVLGNRGQKVAEVIKITQQKEVGEKSNMCMTKKILTRQEEISRDGTNPKNVSNVNIHKGETKFSENFGKYICSEIPSGNNSVNLIEPNNDRDFGRGQVCVPGRGVFLLRGKNEASTISHPSCSSMQMGEHNHHNPPVLAGVGSGEVRQPGGATESRFRDDDGTESNGTCQTDGDVEFVDVSNSG
ncbi:hypothetical protein BUALT_Bualt08G0104200 [Buddleja alternifolia]|uniref:DUF4283 domain-containing protein n=1 Tax=Buddleja alternifolia TaxID=168488 RepID=A0AAV6X5N4_9LAMI|nr:hypothetical protein BUALT_Bualt08G0104200 [Buddleja alternifolia]